jgi:hypothetical protein
MGTQLLFGGEKRVDSLRLPALWGRETHSLRSQQTVWNLYERKGTAFVKQLLSRL